MVQALINYIMVKGETLFGWAPSKKIKKESLARRSRAWPGPGLGGQICVFVCSSEVRGFIFLRWGGGVGRKVDRALYWYGPSDFVRVS